MQRLSKMPVQFPAREEIALRLTHVFILRYTCGIHQASVNLPMPNEADTCRTTVVPKLHAAGWEDDFIAEQRIIAPGLTTPANYAGPMAGLLLPEERRLAAWLRTRRQT